MSIFDKIKAVVRATKKETTRPDHTAIVAGHADAIRASLKKYDEQLGIDNANLQRKLRSSLGVDAAEPDRKIDPEKFRAAARDYLENLGEARAATEASITEIEQQLRSQLDTSRRANWKGQVAISVARHEVELLRTKRELVVLNLIDARLVADLVALTRRLPVQGSQSAADAKPSAYNGLWLAVANGHDLVAEAEEAVALSLEEEKPDQIIRFLEDLWGTSSEADGLGREFSTSKEEQLVNAWTEIL